MLDSLIRWSLDHRAVVLFMTAALLIWGGYSIRDTPLDVLPDLTAPTVTVLVEARGMAPTEMEALVTFPIESAINGAPGVRRVRSATAVGVAVIWVEFDWGQEIYRARQTVNEKLSLVSAALPSNVDKPYLAPISSIMGEILFVTLESDRHSGMELRTVADTVLRRRILAVPGVAQVVPTGGDQKQYQVLVSPQALRQFSVSLNDVENALRQGSQNASAGFRVAGGQEYLIQGIGRASSEESIGSIAVTSRDGRPIFVRDVAQVRIGPALKRGEGSHNAEPAVVLGIQKQPGANTLELTRRLDSTLDEIQRSLPSGMKIDKQVFRQADFIERSLENLTKALRDGAILVVIVVVLFLMNVRAAMITLLAIPVSVLTAVLTMNWFGFTINSMSLGGLAIAIGELVDDAIIDVENVMRRLRENTQKPEAERLPAVEVIYRASSEIRSSVVFATVIVVLVFLPLFALSSVEGRLLTPLAFAYVVSLTASLAVALTVTPALCSFLLPNARSILKGHEPLLVSQLKRMYRPTLNWSLDHPILVVIPSILVIIAAGVALSRTGRAFLPEFNEGTLTISAVTLPGTSLADSDNLGRGLERILLGIPEVVSTARRTGRAELDEHVQGVESAELDVTLRMKDRSKPEVLNEIRERVTLLPGMNVTVGQPISHRIDHMLSGTRANIAVKVFGDDLVLLRSLARQMETAMKGINGVVDLSVEQQTDIPTVRVRVRPEDAARFGLQPGDVATKIQTAFVGIEVNRILEGQISFPLVVRYPETRLEDLAVIGKTLIDSPSGAKVPLDSLADVYEDRSPNFISREGVQRKIVVQCNVSGRDLLGVVNEIEAAVGAQVRLPQGYRVEYGGQFESEAEASRRLLVLGGGVIVAILLILATAFHSTRDALIIMLNLPLALVGGVAGVYFAGGVLSVASIIGFITLFGIATRNGIMLVAHIRHLQEVEGVTDLRRAVAVGATERLAPILMTALAAGLALVPIAAGMGKPGSEIQAPMAMVILFGLISSTALNMVVVPAVYLAAGRHKTKST
ncbi:MAG: efflux RND transporter permease subunit [Bryobacteraceae bacterium]|nr:efflux RND transporter permease subunit [Solibacteraceae bacterium]MCO5350044.1 efflux RND transporter permease subunit [Bryobacteraceae bacterium]